MQILKHCKIWILTKQQYPMGKRLNLLNGRIRQAQANRTFKKLVNSRWELFPVKHIRKSLILNFGLTDVCKDTMYNRGKTLMRKYKKSVSLVFMTSLQQSTLARRPSASHWPQGTRSKNHAADILSWCRSKKLEPVIQTISGNSISSYRSVRNVTGHY